MTYSDSESHNVSDFRMLRAEDIQSSESGYARGPERALMIALLFDAIQGYLCYIKIDGREKYNSQYKESFLWVHASACKDYVFSFENVCEGLGLDAGYLRLGLISVANSQDQWKRARRNF